MKKSKQVVCCIMAAISCVSFLASCNSKKSNPENFGKNDVVLISREEGSGTRGAFVELFGIEKKNEKGQKVDYTSDFADITNSTEVMLTSVAENQNAIGYVSLGSLNNSVKALKIEGATPSVSSIKSGSYKIARPFNIITKAGTVSKNASDFISFILSKDGQSIVEKSGYISDSQNGAYVSKNISGKITVAGSSSVTPVMEKLAEAYKVLNPSVSVEVQMSDSTTGVNSALSSICDIGMASRGLKESEIAKGAIQTKIAIDGIAVIVNNSNPIDSASIDAVRDLYIGAITKWGDVK